MRLVKGSLYSRLWLSVYNDIMKKAEPHIIKKFKDTFDKVAPLYGGVDIINFYAIQKKDNM